MAISASFAPGGEHIATDSNFLGFEQIRRPEVDETLTSRYGGELLTGFLDMTGAKKVTGNSEFSHFEKDRLMPKIAAHNTGATVAAGKKATFTVDASAKLDVTLNQPPYPGTASVKNNGMPVRKGDTIAIPGTKGYGDLVLCIVSSVDYSAGNFEAYPLDAGKKIPAIADTAPVEMIIYGNAMGEGSAQNDSLTSTVTKYSNNTQIIKETFELTGSAASEKLWFKSGGSYYWTLKGERDAYYRFQNYKEMTMLMGKKLTNAADAYDTLAPVDGPIKATEGLIPQVLSNGNTFSYASGTGWALTDFENAVKVLDKQKGARNNMVACGIDLSLQIDKTIRTDFNNGALVYGNYKFDESQALNLGFDSIKVGNYTFHKKTVDAFSDAQLGGAQGFNFAKEGLVLPMDMKVDAKSGERVQSMRLRYMAQEGSTSRETKRAYVDYFKTTESGKDKTAVRYLSEMGIECFALNRFGYITLA